MKVCKLAVILILIILLTVSCFDNRKIEINSEIKSETKVEYGPVFDAKLPAIGTWWWTADTMKREEKMLDNLNFLKANKITEVYLLFANTVFDKYYKKLIAEAKKRNIKVAALSGNADWASESGLRNCERWLEEFKKYQESAKEDEKFYGIHIDCEPYQLPEWNTNNSLVLKRYAKVVDTLKAFCDKNSFDFEMDVPLWFADGSLMVQDGADTITIGEYTAKRVDTLTIMSYRDSAQGQIDTAMGLIQFCKKYGKKVVIGCETGNIVPSEPEYVTYYEEGKAYLNQELNNIKTLMQSIYDNYGVSIHHLDPWRKLKN